MGKGKGKGGCAVFEAVGDCIQCIAGTICCCLISGPILIIIGIVFITSAFDNDRGERIDEFKVSVSNWQNGAVDSFNAGSGSDWTYSVTGCQAAITDADLPRISEAEDLGSEAGEDVFKNYETLSYYQKTPQAVNVPQATASSCELSFVISYQGTEVGTITTPAFQQVSESFSQTGCTQTTTSSSSSSSSSSSRNNQASDIRLCESECREQNGTPSGSTYQSFSCLVNRKPDEVCARVTQNANGQWALAQGTLPERPAGARGMGCFLPSPYTTWQEVSYSGTGNQLTVPVRVRSERDPYLYFLDISGGDKDFGLKTSEKLTIGFICLGLGIFIQGLVCCACCAIFKFARGNAHGKQQQKPSNPVGAALYDVSAKYGNYIPGGATATGYPAQGAPATGYPSAGVEKPPNGYGGGDYQASYGAAPPQYGAAPPQYGAAPPPQYGAAPPPQYGGAAPQYPYGSAAPAGAPPAGYPSAV